MRLIMTPHFRAFLSRIRVQQTGIHNGLFAPWEERIGTSANLETIGDPRALSVWVIAARLRFHLSASLTLTHVLVFVARAYRPKYGKAEPPGAGGSHRPNTVSDLDQPVVN